MHQDFDIILASSSPRRIEIMKRHSITPIVIKPECDENLPWEMGKEDVVRFLSLKKALWVERRLIEGETRFGKEGAERLLARRPFIVAADTRVYHRSVIGKPKDRAHAEKMLRQLEGESHYVVTGVTILRAGEPARVSFAEVSRVNFGSYEDDDFESYLGTEEPYDKAGGYAIQGHFKRYITSIEGDYDNIVGFPWEHFAKEFEKLNR